MLSVKKSLPCCLLFFRDVLVFSRQVDGATTAFKEAVVAVFNVLLTRLGAAGFGFSESLEGRREAAAS